MNETPDLTMTGTEWGEWFEKHERRVPAEDEGWFYTCFTCPVCGEETSHHYSFGLDETTDCTLVFRDEHVVRILGV